MPSIQLHPRASTSASADSPHNPLPSLLQTPSGLALLEIQGTINIPVQETQNREDGSERAEPESSSSLTYETSIGKLMFPDYSPQTPDDTKWMKRAYLYVGRYQRMTGEVKKLAKPLAVIQRRRLEEQSSSADAGTWVDAPAGEELEIVEIVRYRILFKNRPEPVNDA